MTLTRLLVSSALAALPAAALAHGHDHDRAQGAAYRLIVADAGAPLVHVVDPADGDVIARIEVTSPARVHVGPGGRLVYLVQGSAGQVAVLDSGLTEEDHGDHHAMRFAAPALLEPVLTGERPVHFNQGGERIAIFFDGTGEAKLYDEPALLAGAAEPALVLASGAAHHGVAVPVGEGAILSLPTPGQNLPDALALVGPDGAERLRVECPRMHGEGKAAGFVAFGCAGGVAVFDLRGATPSARFLPYPADLPAETMVRQLLSPRSVAALVGNFGPEGFVVFDPAAEDGDFVHATFPAPRMAWTLDDSGETGLAILADGRLVRFSALTGAILAEAAGVTAPYSMDRGVVRPMIAAAGERIAVSDPAAGAVVIVEADDLEVLARIDLGGAPQSVVLLASAADDHHH